MTLIVLICLFSIKTDHKAIEPMTTKNSNKTSSPIQNAISLLSEDNLLFDRIDYHSNENESISELKSTNLDPTQIQPLCSKSNIDDLKFGNYFDEITDKKLDKDGPEIINRSEDIEDQSPKHSQ